MAAALLAICAASPAAASDIPDIAQGSSTLFVDLVVNGRADGTLAELWEKDGELWIAPATLRAAGIAIEGDEPIELKQAPGFTANYDAAAQRLYLDVAPSLLPTSRIRAKAAIRHVTQVDPGFVLNYDAYVQFWGASTSASLWSEQRAFSDLATVSNSGILRFGGMSRQGYVRYDTRIRAVDTERALSFTAGDLITHSLPWSSSVRLGGIGIARNFRIRPDLVTVPLPSFSGQATVPSAVDLFVNGYRQQQASVEPGRFVLDQIPVVTGAGEARIVTTDATGRQVETVVPFYVAPDLLQQGMLDFAVEAGALRRGYGLSSFDYGALAFSATARRGLTDKFTLEAHAEATAQLATGGIGAVWAPGLWGAVHVAAGISSHSGAAGHQITLGYSYAGTRFGLGFDHVERSGNYADLGTFDLALVGGGAIRGDRFSASLSLGALGSLGAGYFDNRTQGGLRARIASASWSLPLRRSGASLFAAADHDFSGTGTSMQLRLMIPLGGSSMVSGGMARQPNGSFRGEASASRAVPNDGGFGYAIDAAIDDRGTALGQASGIWRGRSVQASFGASTTPSGSSAWGSVTGALAWIDSRVFAANALPDAFAVVSTGVADVPVYYENQLLGLTNAGGRLFVPRVNAYFPSRFAIDPINLPANAIATKVEARAALRENTGAIIRMPIRYAQSVVVRLTDITGTPLPAGTTAKLADGSATIVGWDGVTVIDDAPSHSTLSAISNGGACTARFTVPKDAQAYSDLGEVPCV
ncbi:fimbria/pilus outer membrane usher protein [Novosphingopyxis sp. YJ-S2-01]|uniref:fimbria/pilus outer membrane usher protein n=1 Tax=Novosphingopyxis sp. YJ-S2-01 TaxID=2794021 RepID=UPI0018DB5FA8|nr:fimbria/pilus outer membrane usher protein [Novosphingopyxis sp. YJ-S2-01]MBH9538519.1 fimbrial biogenesis outer membrane usher protein [Novosphingopyxis sp. YJ-S2-01]